MGPARSRPTSVYCRPKRLIIPPPIKPLAPVMRTTEPLSSIWPDAMLRHLPQSQNVVLRLLSPFIDTEEPAANSLKVALFL